MPNTKTLVKIENWMREQDDPVSVNQIQKGTGCNWNSINDTIEWFESRGMLQKYVAKGVTYYAITKTLSD